MVVLGYWDLNVSTVSFVVYMCVDWCFLFPLGSTVFTSFLSVLSLESSTSMWLDPPTITTDTQSGYLGLWNCRSLYRTDMSLRPWLWMCFGSGIFHEVGVLPPTRLKMCYWVPSMFQQTWVLKSHLFLLPQTLFLNFKCKVKTKVL